MRSLVISLIIVAMLRVSQVHAQEAPAETKVESKIESIGLFKNGLAIVHRSVELPAVGTFRIEDVPSPVHGTFWINSSVSVSAMMTTREIDAPPQVGGSVDLQQELVGKDVTIHFRDGSIPVATGRVVQVAQPQGGEAWSRTYQQPQYSYGQAREMVRQAPFLILDTNGGRVYADMSMIAHLSVDGKTVRQRRPVLLLTIEGPNDQTKGQPVHVSISYLTKGMAWAPAYRVNLDDAKMLTLQQQAVIKNEMEDFKEAELQLISGFPSVQFAHVRSPMSLETNWASFFVELNQRFSGDQGLMANAAQMVVSNLASSPSGVDLSAIPAGEGVDLHYQPIGKRSMREGDSLMLNIAQAKADYERIVEWTVPDTRDAEGRTIDRSERDEERDKSQDSVWDAVRFKNPLPFPMTTAPAMITAGDRFNGQRQSNWVNTGEQTTLQITKALSIRTRSTEQEDQPSGRNVVNIGRREFRKVTVNGELQVDNHRNEAIKLVIRRQFSGDLLKADENPTSTLSEEGVYSVNKRNVLNWTISLPPGESKTLTYHYTVLVGN